MTDTTAPTTSQTDSMTAKTRSWDTATTRPEGASPEPERPTWDRIRVSGPTLAQHVAARRAAAH